MRARGIQGAGRAPASIRAVDTWVVLLRGINVGGKRLIAMRNLQDAFHDMGYDDPVTYIQSGNFVVGSRRGKTARAAPSIERGLSDAFGYEARVVVRDVAEMGAIVRGVPRDWDAADRSMRHNVIFLTDALSPKAIGDSVTPKRGIESMKAGPHVIYWSAPLRTIARTTMVRLSSHPSYSETTVRGLRTTLKLYELMERRLDDRVP